MSIRRTRRNWKVGTDMRMRDPELFKALMASRDLTVRELADLAKCSPAMIGFLRTGAKTGTVPALSERIAGALRVPLEVLYEITPPARQQVAA